MPQADPDFSLQPFLKWAGGKRWFVHRYGHLLPRSFQRYIEPFLGGGAVFFFLCPSSAILADSNQALVETYDAMRTNWRLVWRYLLSHQRHHSKDYYYACRASVFRSPYTRAAQFIYLNRACWNGLYRVNLAGTFNVPIGTKETIVFDTDDFAQHSNALRAAQLSTMDFETTLNLARNDDFIFVDPPYTINHNANGFLKYNERIFSWKDQERLRIALGKAQTRGAKILMTNADHESVRELYRGFGEIVTAPRTSIIAGDPHSRKRSTELIVSIGCKV